MKRLLALLLLALILFVTISVSAFDRDQSPDIPEPIPPEIRQQAIQIPVEEEPEPYALEIEAPAILDQVIIFPEEPEPIVEEPEMYVTEDDVMLLALLTMAEAESETELGQRLVIDSVLNRVDHPCFPGTIHDVIYQKNAYSSMWNGRVDKCEATNEMIDLVLEELENRTNSDAIFFRTGCYHTFGVPLFNVGIHYFSAYGNYI